MVARPDDRLAGRRALVVGASSGIGRGVAAAFAAAGARVVAAARRADLLAELERDVPGVSALVCDVRSADDCTAAVAEAVRLLGGLDVVVYATGVNRLRLLADTDTDTWRDLFDTNVIGAASITRGALDALRAARGRVAYLSSNSVARPWPGLGAYAASKAALDTLVEAWRTEEPDVHFTRVVVGPTVTGMADAWDPDLSARMFDRWHREGYLQHEPATVTWVAEQLVAWAAEPDVPTEVDLLEVVAR